MNHFLLATLEKWSEIDQCPAVILEAFKLPIWDSTVGALMYQQKQTTYTLKGATSTSHRV